MMRKSCLPILSTAAALIALPAQADTLLNTIGVADNSELILDGSQRGALPFSSGTDTEITSISVYLAAGTTYLVGIEADASGLPAGLFLDNTSVSPSSMPVTINPNWSITAGTNYWLVVDYLSGPTGGWERETTSGNFAFSSGTTWQVTTDLLPEALIQGAGSTTGSSGGRVPEPLSISLLGASLAGAVSMRRRKAKA